MSDEERQRHSHRHEASDKRRRDVRLNRLEVDGAAVDLTPVTLSKGLRNFRDRKIRSLSKYVYHYVTFSCDSVTDWSKPQTLTFSMQATGTD